MKLNTKKIEEWITIKSGNEECQFLVSPMTAKESFALINKSVDTKWQKGQQIKDPDFYKMKIHRVNQVIRDWKGIEDEDGNPIPCNKESRELIYSLNSALIDLVLEEAERIGDVLQQQGEEELKNSSAGQNGSDSPA